MFFFFTDLGHDPDLVHQGGGGQGHVVVLTAALLAGHGVEVLAGMLHAAGQGHMVKTELMSRTDNHAVC